MNPAPLTALFIFLICHPLQVDQLFNFAIWNVGQGQWITFRDADYCLHFDMGGEIQVTDQVLEFCDYRKHQLFLSHEDWDHTNFIFSMHKKVEGFCLNYHHPLRRKFLRNIKRCKNPHPKVRLISKGVTTQSSNHKSHVYLLDGKVLIPGDAPVSEEKKWLHHLFSLKILILGHHGSYTSTSLDLLKKIRPTLAIASSRPKKYGHPHPKVKKKLKSMAIPLMQTHQWGNIFLQVD